MTEANKND